MILKLYKNSSRTNVINKDLEFISKIKYKMLGDVNILFPVIVVKNYNRNSNYCYLENLKRYYYIEEITLLKGDLYQLNLHIDVLKTYATEIKEGIYYKEEGFKTIIENEIKEEEFKNENGFILMTGGD